MEGYQIMKLRNYVTILASMVILSACLETTSVQSNSSSTTQAVVAGFNGVVYQGDTVLPGEYPV